MMINPIQPTPTFPVKTKQNDTVIIATIKSEPIKQESKKEKDCKLDYFA